MDQKTIVDYIMESPYNTNKAILMQMLDQYAKGPNRPDEDFINANWEQNDKNAKDYIKNRTHYIEQKITPWYEGKVDFAVASYGDTYYYDTYIIDPFEITLQDGEILTIVVDEKIYNKAVYSDFGKSVDVEEEKLNIRFINNTIRVNSNKIPGDPYSISIIIGKSTTNIVKLSNDFIDSDSELNKDSIKPIENQAVYKAVEAIYEKIKELEALPNHEEYFDITDDGIVSLKVSYRGHGDAAYPYSISNNGLNMNGSLMNTLPLHLVIPKSINSITVTGIQPGAFCRNTRIEEVTLPDTIFALSDWSFREAVNLRFIHNTEQITSIGSGPLSYTRVTELSLPNLTALTKGAFAGMCYLQKINIGNNITTIPQMAFMQNVLLTTVEGGENVKVIDGRGFYLTRSLKSLPFLSNQGLTLGTQAFSGSSINFDWSSRDSSGDGAYATPVVDNTVDYWSSVAYTPCQNELVSKLSQVQRDWRNDIVGNSGVKYESGCPMIAILHIYSAITGRYFNDPRDFVEELSKSDTLKVFLEADHWPGEFEYAAELLQALGYTVEKYTDGLNTTNYKAMCDALASGAYVYTQATSPKYQLNQGYSDGGHAVVIYGINKDGEVLVLDSDFLCENYRSTGVEDDFYTYSMLHPNLVGPNSKFIIVHPPAP